MVDADKEFYAEESKEYQQTDSGYVFQPTPDVPCPSLNETLRLLEGFGMVKADDNGR